jgi:hypothetical protein
VAKFPFQKLEICVEAARYLWPVDIYECRRCLQVFVNASEWLQIPALFVNPGGASRYLLSP